MILVDDCPFCRIAKRELHANVTYEDDRVVAFLPVRPVADGHTLVAPKDHYESLIDLPIELLNDVMTATKSIAADLLARNYATGINLLHASGKDAQQSVFHFMCMWFHDIAKMDSIFGLSANELASALVVAFSAVLSP